MPVPPAVQTTIGDYGDSGLLVTFSGADRETRWSAAHALQQLLRPRAPAVVDVVAGFDTAFVTFDPLVLDHDQARALVRRLLGLAVPRGPVRELAVPVVYGGERGPDLDEVAAELGLEPTELVRRHTATEWIVRLRGSPAASPMMDGPVWPEPVPRSATPRIRLPAGSVGLSGQQCMVYAADSPGGWRLVGQTPARLVDVERDGLVVYTPGDRFRFVAVPETDWERWAGPLDQVSDELSRASP